MELTQSIETKCVCTCYKCHVELFVCTTMEIKTMHESYCIVCASELNDRAWRYEQCNK